jgi:septum formation protein
MEEAVVLSADTVVHLNGQCLGKPAHAEEAADMLNLLSGQTHQVTTAVALRSPTGVHEFLSTSRVSFRVLNATEIEAYVASLEPMDKAGGYGIQGRGAGLVKHVEGCHTTVVGLPLPETLKQLARLGVVPR